ncbi:MAG: methyltransferase domain-containing protein [Candidatus Kuenenia stuttgartiensis]|nr:methyltransferase domain-containing protein [Candidatus Kuenenia stuttgartiensis]
MFLDIGTRAPNSQNTIKIDNSIRMGVNVLCDLNKFPYPFKDNSFQTVRIWDYLEHLDDIVKVTEEIYRILKAGGTFKIMVPHFSNYYAFTDPTHKHFFGLKTMDYFIPTTITYSLGYTTAKYEKIRTTIGFPDEARGLKKFILKLINKFPEYYERYFAFIFPASGIYYELRAIK